MRLAAAEQKHQLKAIQSLYKQAFPRVERKPFFILLKKQKTGSVELLSIEDESGGFLGLAVMVFYRDLVLLDYFAISPDKRGGGTGSKAFQLLKERYQDKRFFLEIESTEAEAKNTEERIRRKAFYMKNGMTRLPFMVKLFGVKMELLADNCTLDFEEYYEIYYKVFGITVSRTDTLPGR